MIWRPVVGWEGLYQVSDMGEVRSVPRVMPCSNGKTRTCIGTVLRKSYACGYARVNLCKSGREKTYLVHRLVAEAFIPGVGEVVRHIDGDKGNCCVSNLCWGSHEQNAEDKRSHGKHLEGERHPMATVSAEDVVKIRNMSSSGMSQLAICRYLGLGRGVVGPIVRGEAWRSVK